MLAKSGKFSCGGLILINELSQALQKVAPDSKLWGIFSVEQIYRASTNLGLQKMLQESLCVPKNVLFSSFSVSKKGGDCVLFHIEAIIGPKTKHVLWSFIFNWFQIWSLGLVCKFPIWPPGGTTALPYCDIIFYLCRCKSLYKVEF